MNVLGIDVSTSITGFAIQNEKGELIHNSFCNTTNKNKFPTIYDKADAVEAHQKDLDSKYDICYVYLEQRLMRVKKGASSASVQATQCEFNGMVSLQCHHIFPSLPQHIHPSSARAGIKPKVIMEAISASKKTDGKQRAMQFVLDNYPSFSLEYTRHGNIKAHCWDMSDAIVIARAGQKIEQKKKGKNED